MVYISRSSLLDTVYAERIRDILTAVLLILFACNVVFLPADNFGLKKASFFLLVFANLDRLTKLQTNDELFAGIFGFGLTTYCICKSVLLNGDIAGDIGYGFAGYILLLYIIIKKSKMPLVHIMMNLLAVMALMITISGVLDQTGILSVYYNKPLMWMYHNNNALVGSTPDLPIGISIFLFASPLLLLAIPWFISRHMWAQAFITIVAVVFSGTRANILMGLAIAFVSLVLASNKPHVKYLLCIIGGLLLIYIVFRYNIIGLIGRMFEKKVTSDSIRSLEFQSIMQVWKDEPLRLISGQGFSTPFYNTATQTFTVSVEWSYINLLRQIGVIPFLLMMLMFLAPAINAIKENKNIIIAVGYIGYLAVAATNPLLYTSTGMTALLLLLCISLLDNQDISNERNRRADI